MAKNTVTVQITGQPKVEFDLDHLDRPIESVQDALHVAASSLGTRIDTTTVGIIKNGEPVDGNAPVNAGDVIASSISVANG